MSISFITTTSYGTWLPGSARGYVRNGHLLPEDAKLLELSRGLLKSRPVYFSPDERDRLFESLYTACEEFEYRLSDVAIESWHLHWILFHGDDEVDVVVGRLKTRMRQSLSRGRIWTEGYCAEPLFSDREIESAQEYIALHRGCMMTNSNVLGESKPPAEPGAASDRNVRCQ
jgi:hypothetical protein